MIFTAVFSNISAMKYSTQTTGSRIVADSTEPRFAKVSLAELLAALCCYRDSAKGANNLGITDMAALSFSSLMKVKGCACRGSRPLTCHPFNRARPQHNPRSSNSLMHFHCQRELPMQVALQNSQALFQTLQRSMRPASV